MDFTNKALVAGDKRYLVIESVKYDGKTYVFIVNAEDQTDSNFVEAIEKDGNITTSPIAPELFKNEILPLFVEKFEAY